MARGKVSGRYGPGRNSAPEEDESSRWLGTYGDAVTLLMAFFVMLYAMSQVDQAKFEAFLSGLEGPFGNAAAAELLDSAPAIVGDAGAQTPARQAGAVTFPQFPEPIEGANLPDPALPDPRPEPVPDAGATPDPGTSKDVAAAPAAVDASPPEPVIAPGAGRLEEMDAIRAAIEASLAAQGLTGAADLEIDHRGLVVSISADQVLFATGSTQISDLGRRVVRAVALPLLSSHHDLLVEGHTDDVPLNRAGYTNWNLSTDRAVAVLTLLYADVGIAQQRLGAIGYGEFRPRAPNDSPQHRALNRRVDILVVAPELTSR